MSTSAQYLSDQDRPDWPVKEIRDEAKSLLVDAFLTDPNEIKDIRVVRIEDAVAYHFGYELSTPEAKNLDVLENQYINQIILLALGLAKTTYVGYYSVIYNQVLRSQFVNPLVISSLPKYTPEDVFPELFRNPELTPEEKQQMTSRFDLEFQALRESFLQKLSSPDDKGYFQKCTEQPLAVDLVTGHSPVRGPASGQPLAVDLVTGRSPVRGPASGQPLAVDHGISTDESKYEKCFSQTCISDRFSRTGDFPEFEPIASPPTSQIFTDSGVFTTETYCLPTINLLAALVTDKINPLSKRRFSEQTIKTLENKFGLESKLVKYSVAHTEIPSIESFSMVLTESNF